MNLPVVSRQVGKADGMTEVYLEDYVVSYLNWYRKEKMYEGGPVILYGKKVREDGKDLFLIDGAGEEELVRERDFFKQKKELGCLSLELFRNGENEWDGILTGDRKGGQPVKGYFIFYAENEEMKEYLSCFYKKIERENGGKGGKRKPEKTQEKDSAREAFLPELKALSEETEEKGRLLFSFLRAAVVCIFIILCAIAVSTVNSYEKLKEFTETAAQMGETMEEYESMPAGDAQ